MVGEILKISRTKAQNLIKDGYVFVDNKMVDKASFGLVGDENITINEHDSYVSRGAYKLIKALDEFGVNPSGKVVLDMGASTGGFTQVLVDRGATKVYSVDVGKGELDPQIAKMQQVVNMEGRDIRSLTKEEVGDCKLVVGDLSFISLTKILPQINMVLGKIECAILFKPQFECGKDLAKKYRGVIKDKAVHKRLLREFKQEIEVWGYSISNLTYSPIKGGSGNIEYLVHLNGQNKELIDIDKIVDEGFEKL